MRLAGLLELHQRAEKYKSLFKRAMVLARQYRDERDEARREVWALENSDDAQVVALESRVRILETRLTEAESAMVRAMDQLTPEHDVFFVLDDYDGSMDAVRRLQEDLERARQEALDAARTPGQLIRLVRDNGWMTEDEILALPDEAPRLAAAAGRPRRYRREQAEQAQAAIAAVRKLHSRDEGLGPDAHGLFGCMGCDPGETWPCATLRALDATSAPQPKDAEPTCGDCGHAAHVGWSCSYIHRSGSMQVNSHCGCYVKTPAPPAAAVPSSGGQDTAADEPACGVCGDTIERAHYTDTGWAHTGDAMVLSHDAEPATAGGTASSGGASPADSCIDPEPDLCGLYWCKRTGKFVPLSHTDAECRIRQAAKDHDEVRALADTEDGDGTA